VLYVGGLPQEVEAEEQEAVAADLFVRFACLPGARKHTETVRRSALTPRPAVYLGAELKEKYYSVRPISGLLLAPQSP